VAIYRADIQIAVRGATQVTNLQQRLNTLAGGVDQLNARIRSGTLASITSLNNLVSQSDRIMRSAAVGTRIQRDAIDAYVRSTAAAERAEVSLQRAITRRRRELGLAQPRATGGAGAGGGGSFGGRIGGAVSGAVIGGSFPLLFGQGAGAAAGGAVGGLVGGLLGPGGSFAGSLLGTLLGDIASKGQQVKELATDIGFTAEQTKRLQEAFKLAGSESDKFIESVQNIRGLSLSLDDQADSIQLVSKLTEVYGGKIEKVTNAFTSALESGKVTQATLNQLTSQGIPIQDELAKKYGVSRDKLLQMAKDGKISVQELVDVLVAMGNKGVAETGKTESGFEKLKKSVDSLGSALADLGGSLVRIFEGPFNFILDGLARITSTAAESINIISDLLKFSDPTKIETTAAIQAGRMPRGGKQSVIDVIGQDRLSQIEKQAGPGFSMETPVGKIELGTDVSKVLELLKQQPEFKVTETKIGKIDTPSQLPPSGKAGKTGKTDAEKAAEEAKRLAEQIRKQTKAAESLKIQQQGSLAILRTRNDFEKAFVEFSVNRAAIQRRYEELALQSKSTAERALLTEARALEFKQNSLELQKQIAELTTQATAPLDDIVSKLKDQVAFEREYGELIKNGTNPELAKQIIEINRAYEASAAALVPALAAAQAAVTRAEAEGASATEIQKYREELERIQAIQSGLPAKKTEAIGAATELTKPKTTMELIEAEADAAKLALDKLVEPANMIATAAAGIGDAFATSFKGIVDGSMTAKEGLATFFKSVADMFLDMAAQMIAAWIKMAILNTIVKIFGGAASSAAGGGFGAGGAGFGGSNGFSTFDAGGAQAFSMPSLMPLAEGGFVTGPTSAMIGEGGESEYVIPASKMQSAMSRYSRGARGEGVIAGSGGGTEGGTATAAAGPMVVDVRYSVERINDVEYVTASQFQAGMRQAAQQGAALGERNTVRRLQYSPGGRKGVGM
jgi:tape measure domain-containing protein